MGLLEWFERTFFGGYTGDRAGQRQFIYDRLRRLGYSHEIVERVLREEFDRADPS